MHGFGPVDRFDPLLVGDPPDLNHLKDQTTLCSYREDQAALAEGNNPADLVTVVDGRPTLKVSGQARCPGRHLYWFGDSDLSQTDDITIDYAYDLTLQPDAQPIRAVDDGPTVVDYPSNAAAPAQTHNVLLNDIGADLWIDNLGASPGEAVAPNFGAGDRGQVRYAPPLSKFVGPASVAYGIRTGSDPVGTSRSNATWRLRYRQCNDHTIDLDGKVSQRERLTAARASGRYRVCTDGKTATGKVISVNARVPLSIGVWGRLIGAAVRGLTRGKIGFEATARWKKSRPGASSLSADLIVCETWFIQVNPNLVLSPSNQKRLLTILKKYLPDRLAKTLMDRLHKRIEKPFCHSEVRYKAGPVTSTPVGYGIRLHHDANNQASPIRFGYLTTEVGSTRFLPHPLTVALVCPYEAYVNSRLEIGRCRVRSNGPAAVTARLTRTRHQSLGTVCTRRPNRPPNPRPNTDAQAAPRTRCSYARWLLHKG